MLSHPIHVVGFHAPPLCARSVIDISLWRCKEHKSMTANHVHAPKAKTEEQKLKCSVSWVSSSAAVGCVQKYKIKVKRTSVYTKYFYKTLKFHFILIIIAPLISRLSKANSTHLKHHFFTVLLLAPYASLGQYFIARPLEVSSFLTSYHITKMRTDSSGACDFTISLHRFYLTAQPLICRGSAVRY